MGVALALRCHIANSTMLHVQRVWAFLSGLPETRQSFIYGIVKLLVFIVSEVKPTRKRCWPRPSKPQQRQQIRWFFRRSCSFFTGTFLK